MAKVGPGKKWGLPSDFRSSKCFVSNKDGLRKSVAVDPSEVPGATPAVPGEFISLFATGFGPTDPPFNAGEVPQTEVPPGTAELTNLVSVAIGGLPVPDQDIFYAGVAPCCAGLYQLVVKVPDNAPDGDLPVVATVGGVSTPNGPYVTVKGL